MKKHKQMAYPYYRRNEDTFYKVEDEYITAIAPNETLDFYEFVGNIEYTPEAPDEETVLGYTEIPEQDWDAVVDDLKEVARVGSRPNIPPPPGL